MDPYNQNNNYYYQQQAAAAGNLFAYIIVFILQ